MSYFLFPLLVRIIEERILLPHWIANPVETKHGSKILFFPIHFLFFTLPLSKPTLQGSIDAYRSFTANHPTFPFTFYSSRFNFKNPTLK